MILKLFRYLCIVKPKVWCNDKEMFHFIACDDDTHFPVWRVLFFPVEEGGGGQ